MRSSPSGSVPSMPLPATWAGGATLPEVERIVAGISSSWAISTDAARVVARIVVHERRTRLLEFGAGGSSRILAAALEEIGGGRLTSLEEAPHWSADAWELVRQSPNVDARLIPASIHLRLDRRGLYFGYGQLTEVADRGPYDFLFVDAPAGAYGRDGALYAVVDSLMPGALIVLDDAARPREQRTVRRWLLNYPQLRLIANDPDVARGLAVLEKRETPEGAAPGLPRRLGVWSSSAYDVLRSPWGIHKQRRRIRRAGRAWIRDRRSVSSRPARSR